MNYVINTRPYTIFSEYKHELLLKKDKNYLFDLAYLAVLNVEGNQAETFLQGQLTCDVRKVNLHTMRQGALCNLKGRIQALLDVIKIANYQLILPKDLIAATLISLNKAAMLSRVKLEVNTNYRVYGFYLGNSEEQSPIILNLPKEKNALTVHNDNYYYCIEESYFIILSPVANHDSLVAPFISTQRFQGSLAWHRLQTGIGKIEIYPDTRGLFLPHRIELHQQGYISFDKGCYKGQEIIARTHYRAKLKHRLAVFRIQIHTPINAGNKLFDLNQREVGEIIDYCPLDANEFIIVTSILIDHPSEVNIEGVPTIISLRTNLD
ncbi:YgfZ/GcvT domain-containing protein [Legionella sp. D16C41]|uniref:CAF17-like 4Fe-4S cluster assembly/insertion protein YgfZ n=1 Tax=Legionella sp. D16C41 TaxID=3402688 RepID=UPI003AF7921F